ncbi:MAG: ABC transporter ATP-binding protein [Anaerobacillus sp.]|uniref:ABC transporter ATP-binding protein n=1 Tax=Anaerobacillus sp. TaxID=1872506 RepID=UPI00391B65B7
MNNIIEVRNGMTKFKGFELGPINIEIPRGMITALIGRNGAGKTTFLKGISGLSPFHEGSVTYNGSEIDFLDPLIRTKMTYISNDLQMYSDFTVKQSLNFISKLHKNWADLWIEEWLRVFQILPRMQIHQLSKGMKMKFNLLLGLGHEPNLVLLDEPTDGLDSISRQQFFDLLQAYIEKDDRSVVISTHYTKEIESICDYVIFIKNGTTPLFGEVETLKEAFKVFSLPPNETISGINGIISSVTTRLEKKGIIRSEAVTNLPEYAVIKKPTLDDLFLFVVEEGDTGKVKGVEQ